MLNYSFWADEAYNSGIAVQLALGKLTLLQAFNTMPYQKLYIVILAFFFKLFGRSEFVARLPSLIAFFLGIIVIFFLAKKLSNFYGGIISSFLYTFSHLNLSYATQARPYSALETITLLIVLLTVGVQTEKHQRRVLIYHVSIISFLCIATFLHTIGVLLWILYLEYVIQKLRSNKVTKFKHLRLLTVLVFVFTTMFIATIALPYLSNKLLQYNNSYQVIKLFAYKYTLILIPAVFGYIWLFRKNRELSIVIFTYSVVVFILAIFQQYIFNIRYVLSLFGILFLYFGIFWAKVGERLNLKFEILNFKFRINGSMVVTLCILLVFIITRYKIALLPQLYYNPNIDKYGDIQITNYKNFYTQLKTRFPQYRQIFITNDTLDAEYWYLGRYSNAYFTKFTLKPHKNIVANAMVYGSLSDFIKQKSQHPQGLLIMEDWQSFLVDDIKAYVKRNLKLEFRVESLKEAPDDPWPLALYSWGL